MSLLTRKLFVLLGFLLFVGLGTTQAQQNKQSSKKEQVKEQSFSAEVEKLIDYGKELLGKRYRSRGPGGVMLDCSGFVGYVFSRLNIKLPRCSRDMASYTKSIKKKDVRPGDLLYFSGRAIRGGVGHVGMVVDVDGDDVTMIHSSTSRGVVIEKYNRSTYFARRFLGAGRVADLEKLVEDIAEEVSPEKK